MGGNCMTHILPLPPKSQSGALSHTRNQEGYQQITLLHWWKHTVKIHNDFNQFGAAADVLPIGMKEGDITLLLRTNKKCEIIKTSFTLQGLWCDKLIESCCGTLYWAIKEVGVVKPCTCPVKYNLWGKKLFKPVESPNLTGDFMHAIIIFWWPLTLSLSRH